MMKNTRSASARPSRIRVLATKGWAMGLAAALGTSGLVAAGGAL